MSMRRLSLSQRQVLRLPDVSWVGTDARGRPVVEARVGIPQRLQRWALLRSGDPADVTEPVTPNPSHTPV
jgi:hypothetical protein